MKEISNMYKGQDNYILNQKYYLKCLVRNIEGNVNYLDYNYGGSNLIHCRKKNISQSSNVNLFSFQNKRNKDIVFNHFLTFNSLPKNFSYSKLFVKSLNLHFETKIENRINLLKPIKAGFFGYCNGIVAFIPKRHVSKMLKHIKTKKSSQLSTQLFFSNLHKSNSLMFPKLTGRLGKPSLVAAKSKYRKFQKRILRLRPSFIILHNKYERTKKQTFKENFVRKYRF